MDDNEFEELRVELPDNVSRIDERWRVVLPNSSTVAIDNSTIDGGIPPFTDISPPVRIMDAVLTLVIKSDDERFSTPELR